MGDGGGKSRGKVIAASSKMALTTTKMPLPMTKGSFK
jgi:hypothetical protein